MREISSFGTIVLGLTLGITASSRNISDGITSDAVFSGPSTRFVFGERNIMKI